VIEIPPYRWCVLHFRRDPKSGVLKLASEPEVYMQLREAEEALRETGALVAQLYRLDTLGVRPLTGSRD
jgi:hypothetical protein